MSTQRPLVIIGGQVQQLPSGDVAIGAVSSNAISVPITVAADTSYMVVGYLDVSSDLTVNGNVGIM